MIGHHLAMNPRFLVETQARRLAPQTQALILLDHADSLSKTLRTLYANGILSAPVLKSNENLILGSVDTVDILTFIFDVPRDTPKDQWDEIVKEKFRRPITEVIAYSKLNPFLPVSEKASVAQVISEYFAFGIHRVPLFNETGNLISLITQIDVIPFLQQNMSSLGDLGNQTVADLDFLPGNVTSIYEDASLKSAFADIVGAGLSAIAVVKRDGRLAGNLSASDFKGVTEENFVELNSPISTYTKYQRPVFCRRHTTFAALIDLFGASLVHRVFIVDNEERPIGLVTLTDVCKVIRNKLTTSSM